MSPWAPSPQRGNSSSNFVKRDNEIDGAFVEQKDIVRGGIFPSVFAVHPHRYVREGEKLGVPVQIVE